MTSYQLQMQQVEAALTTDPDNNELLTLKQDLQQVISLTQQLIAAQSGEGAASDEHPAATSTSEAPTRQTPVAEEDAEEAVPKKRSARPHDHLKPVKHWQVGEQCQAIWTKDGQYYEAIIDEITTDGEVSVSFTGYGNSDVTTLGLLKISSLGITGSASSANKKELLAKQREYLKKKKAKKLERFKQMDKEREDEKSKWQNFSTKAFGKKGFVKKSIFKTPENAQGRVGIGTCGVSGQEMTKYSSGVKYKKGH